MKRRKLALCLWELTAQEEKQMHRHMMTTELGKRHDDAPCIRREEVPRRESPASAGAAYRVGTRWRTGERALLGKTQTEPPLVHNSLWPFLDIPPASAISIAVLFLPGGEVPRESSKSETSINSL